jgi:glycosyltransferase involved in cell wall biosynthesis
MAFYGAWAARLAGVPHVITMHGGRYYAAHMRRRLALRLALALSDRMVAVSHRLAADLRRDLRVAASRVSVLPNGVRAERAHPGTVRDELGLGPGDRLLVSVGNLYPVKGHRHLIDALGLLRERNHEPHLAIAGRGDLADALTARAHHLGLADRVHLLGLRSDIPALLAAADAFVLPSLSEGLPLALLEAMFAGCPIVASEVGEVGAALGDGEAGLLVPAGDSAALANSLEKVLADPARAREMGERAARRAATEYDVAQMVRRYGALYEAAGRHAEPSPGLGGLTQDET